ncbi:putative transcription factor c2h2 protein [Botrytis fragariae]|uniref:Putative transcription factor c2h2 protein n=1 Tax=Botrytis fragariae TaxID=1964551 RepID=A0A8H6B267_9HELO|nr:putative transcription factor c2h2 protein [Botrytis fragariae]KAF5877692.1 putative transcription factor c2h2 protein [Botrytis fragariae]
MSSPVEFNYSLPIQRDDGNICHMPNFTSDLWLARARNSEVPDLIHDAIGYLTAEEDRSIQMNRISPNRKVFVNENENASFTAQQVDSKTIQEELSSFVMEGILKLRKMFLRRGEGKDSEKCRFEQILRSGKGEKSRTYTMGWSIPPNADSGGVATATKGHFKHCDELAEAAQLIAKVSQAIIRYVTPAEELRVLELQSEIDVAYTVGDEENKNFSTVQVNYSNVNTVSLSVEMGKSGSLHIDAKDDPARMSVLLNLSNLVEGCWPGTFTIMSLRDYWVFAPCDALVFRARHPHFGIPPRMMGGSPRKPYVAPIPELAWMDPELYNYSRLVLVAYPQKYLMNRAPSLKRYKMPDHYQQDNPLAITFPHGEAFALAAWGTLRHQHEKIAMQDAWCLAHRHNSGSLAVLPSAKSIAKREVWKDKDGNIVLPRVARIQTVLDGNTAQSRDSDQAKAFARLREITKLSLSHDYFEHRSTHIDAQYVSVLGSSLIKPPDVAPEKKLTRAATHAMFGEKPYQCPLCEKRVPDPFALRVHFKTYHKNDRIEDFEDVLPTRDPNHLKYLQEVAASSVAESSKKGGKRRRISDSENDEPPAQKIKAEDLKDAIAISDDEEIEDFAAPSMQHRKRD